MPSSDASELGDELAFLGRVVTVSRQQHHRALYFQRLRLAHRRMVEAHTCCKPSGLAPIGGAEAAVAAIERATTSLRADGSMAWAIELRTMRGLSLAVKGGDQAGFSSMVMWSSTERIGVVAFTTVGMSSKTLAGLGLEVLVAVRGPP